MGRAGRAATKGQLPLTFRERTPSADRMWITKKLKVESDCCGATNLLGTPLQRG
jgi:hypothetical protein